MKTRSTLTLNRFHCVEESDGKGHSEPYIWPVLIRVDDDTLATPERVSLITRGFGNEREIIKSGMRAGENAALPNALRSLSVLFENEQQVHTLIFDVLVWEADETPEDAVRAGFKAFTSAFEKAIGENLFELSGANDEQRQIIIDEIQKHISKKVKDAIWDSLSVFEKGKAIVGSLNFDDIVGNSFILFQNPHTKDQDFTMSFSNAAAHNGNPSEAYEIFGTLNSVPVEEETCEVQAAAVHDARKGVKAIEKRIERLQARLGNASPQMKPGLIRLIRNLKSEGLSNAEAQLEAAKKALQLCRLRDDLFGKFEDIIQEKTPVKI